MKTEQKTQLTAFCAIVISALALTVSFWSANNQENANTINRLQSNLVVQMNTCKNISDHYYTVGRRAKEQSDGENIRLGAVHLNKQVHLSKCLVNLTKGNVNDYSVCKKAVETSYPIEGSHKKYPNAIINC